MKHKQPIALFPVPALEEIEPDIREQMLRIQEKSGFIPNIFLALAGRPAEFRAFFDYHDALMDSESNLTKGEREMIVVATSGLNQCLYCVVAHGAILRIREKNPTLSDQLATNYRKADITPKQRAMLDYAVKVSQASHEITEQDHAPLRAEGFSQDDIWQIGAISAFFAMSNRIANMTSLQPNTEFYGFAR